MLIVLSVPPTEPSLIGSGNTHQVIHLETGGSKLIIGGVYRHTGLTFNGESVVESITH